MHDDASDIIYHEAVRVTGHHAVCVIVDKSVVATQKVIFLVNKVHQLWST
jgi:hypothetical protein